MALTVIAHGALAGGIDLDCEALSRQMIERLDAAGLLVHSAAGSQQALAIAMDLCREGEASAQHQNEADKQEALDNWLSEKHPEKPGNTRLKNLKR